VFDRELRVMETTVDGLEVYRVEEG
jgi:hypothetical protein